MAGKTTDEIIVGDIVYDKYGTWRLNYIQVPVNFIYHFKVQGGKLFIGAGPYISKPLSGRFTTPPDHPSPASSQFSATDPDIDAKFGSEPGKNFKAFDSGINALAGFEFSNGIIINAVYNAGLSNIQTDKYLYDSTKTRSLGISLGYKF
ncbi:outer membrane beta-barrel protein [Mucilaginibacter celer]|uniref:outer membrane beta-barrel protein n=1 Tax=Mucilaginibacter celer TaxID=2305508 RepID=UPI003CCB3D12